MENSCDWVLERLNGFRKLFSDPASYCTWNTSPRQEDRSITGAVEWIHGSASRSSSSPGFTGTTHGLTQETPGHTTAMVESNLAGQPGDSSASLKSIIWVTWLSSSFWVTWHSGSFWWGCSLANGKCIELIVQPNTGSLLKILTNYCMYGKVKLIPLHQKQRKKNTQE